MFNASKSWTWPWRAISIVVVFVAGARAVEAFRVSGVIKDASGDPLPLIRVTVFDAEPLKDDPLAVIYTDETGSYSVELTEGWGSEKPDIYVKAEWRFALTPAISYNNHEIIFRGVDDEAFAAARSVTYSGHDPNSNLPIDVSMSHAEPNIGILRLRINQALNFYLDHKGATPWTIDADIPATVVTTSNSFFRLVDDGEIFIARNDIMGTGTEQPHPQMADGNTVDIYHEIGHLVHYRINGNSLPDHTTRNPHHIMTESDRGNAIVEGWPSFVATLTAEANSVVDNKYRAARDPDSINWRGDEEDPGTTPPTPRPTGYENGRFESGEIVEGAVSGVYYELFARTGNNFGNIFHAMVNRKPNNVREFVDEFINLTGRNVDAYEALYKHGIPFARARFEGDPFEMKEPPQTGSADEGNAKEIEGRLFLRGKTKVDFGPLTTSDLGVHETLDLDKVRLGYKSTAVGVDDEAGSFALFAPWSADGSSPFEIDTEKLNDARGDGEWDFVIVGGNAGGLLDTLLPYWRGDATPEVNSDEKYLKKIGTWYDKDRDPTTEDDGKVIVDNTAPKVENFKPKP